MKFTGYGIIFAAFFSMSLLTGCKDAQVTFSNLASTSRSTASAAVAPDLIPPAVLTFDKSIAQTTTTKDFPINFEIEFTEPVTGFTASDIAQDMAITTPATGVVWSVALISGNKYSVQATTATSNGNIKPKILAGSVLDLAGNIFGAQVSATTQVNLNIPVPNVFLPNAAIFPSAYFVQYSLGTLNFDNDWNLDSISDGDAYVDSYFCAYDRLVDGGLIAGGVCSGLPGTANFNVSTGVLNWTPDYSAWGPYEICVSATNNIAGASGTVCTMIEVSQAISYSFLTKSFDAQFAKTSGGQASGAYLSFADLTEVTRTNNAMTLVNFNFNASSGWLGNQTLSMMSAISNPYRLIFDGVNDYLQSNNELNNTATTMFEGWMKYELGAPSSNHILWSNANATNGFNLATSPFADNKLLLKMGSSNTYLEEIGNMPGLVRFYRLSSNSNEVTSMINNNQNIGTAYNTSLASNPSIVDNDTYGLNFNGTNAYVNMGTVSPVSGNTISVCAWVNPTSSQYDKGLVTKANDQIGDYEFLLGIMWNNGSGMNKIRWRVGGTELVSATAISNSAWTYVCATRSSTTMKVYFNGVLDASIGTSGSIANNAGDQLMIGAYYNPSLGGAAYFFNGKIDDVAIFNTELTLGQISLVYSERLKPACLSKNIFGTGTWHNIATGFDSTGNTLRLMIDGYQECSLNTGANVYANAGNSTNLTVGAGLAGAMATNLSLAQFRAYAGDASPATVSTNINATNAQFPRVPETVTNLDLWLVADDLNMSVINGDPVTTWTSRSNGHAFISAGTNAPSYSQSVGALNGRSAVTFDGVNDYMQNTTVTALQNASQYTSFIVFVPASSSGFQYLLQSNGNHVRQGLDASTKNILSEIWNGVVTNTATFAFDMYGNGSPILYSSKYGGTISNDISMNAAVPVANVVTVPADTDVGSDSPGVVLGANGTMNGYYLNGQIAEVIIYSRALNSLERSQIERYLGRKYNVDISW